MENRKISFKTARTICIVKTLAKFGHFPTKESEKEAWYLSPLRSESQASFKVSRRLNLWYDFGMGKGGNVIDLLMEMNQYSVNEAMEFLAGNSTDISFHQQPVLLNRDREDGISIIRTSRITHVGLVNYLESRKIPLGIARSYCKEVRYGLSEKEYFAIGLENHLGGWELRNKYYKNSSSPKSYTFFRNSSDRLVVLEGMFDFLSLATLDPEQVNTSDCIVLNSLSFIRDIQILLPEYSQILLYLDNDPAGKKATKELLGLFNNITDRSHYYKNYEDLNEKLKHQ